MNNKITPIFLFGTQGDNKKGVVRWLIFTCVSLSVLLGALLFVEYPKILYWRMIKKQIVTLQQKITQLQPAYDKYQQLKDKQQIASKHIKKIEYYQNHPNKPITLFDVVRSHASNKITFNQLQITKKKLSLTIYSSDMASMYTFIDKLSSDEHFKNVHIASLQHDDSERYVCSLRAKVS